MFDSWLLQQAADLADFAATHLSIAVSAIQHDTHLLLEEITSASLHNPIENWPGINGGCSEI